MRASAPKMTLTPSGGSILSQTGCLYETRKYFNGYQIIIIDTENEEAEFSIRCYYDKRRAFDIDPKMTPEGIFKVQLRLKSAAVASANVNRVLRNLRPHIRQTASDHINMQEANATLHFDAKEAFVCPPLSRNEYPHEQVMATSANRSKAKAESVSLEELLRDNRNISFFGNREVGKSSLAHFIAVNMAEGLTDRPRVPILIDFRHFKRNNYGLKKAIATFAQGLISPKDVDELLELANTFFSWTILIV